MADTLLARLKEFFTGNESVEKVANDPVLSAELLLLFRVMLADGVISDDEMAAFRSICETAFGLAGDDLDKVIAYLEDAGYETTGRQALTVFQDLPLERRQTLIRHMADIARADKHVHPDEFRLIKRASEMLDLTD